MRTTESKAFGERSSEAHRKLPAALLTSWFRGPSSSSTRLRAASTASGSLTSQGVAAARPPAARTRSVTSCSGSGRRPTTATRAPSSARRKAIERPSPVPPPVMSVVFPASRSGRNGSMGTSILNVGGYAHQHPPNPPTRSLGSESLVPFAMSGGTRISTPRTPQLARSGVNPSLAASIIYPGRPPCLGRVSWGGMRHSAFDRYASAVLLVGGALLIKLILAPLLDEPAPFLLFFGAVAAAGWRGGIGPGLLAAGLAVVASHVFFLAAGGRPAADESVRLGLFAIESVTVAFLA